MEAFWNASLSPEFAQFPDNAFLAGEMIGILVIFERYSLSVGNPKGENP